MQAGDLYTKVMKDQDRTNLISNLTGALKGANKEVIFFVNKKLDPRKTS